MLEAKAAEKEEDSKPAASLKSLGLKAGQKLPGSGASVNRLAQGALGRERSGRGLYGRPKLGIDTTPLWASL